MRPSDPRATTAPPPRRQRAVARRRVTDRVNVARALTAAGEMPTRIATFDWKRTPLGPLEEWPISLRAAAAMVVENRFPMTLFWGPELCHVYNDAYIPVLGGKHPSALGQPAPTVWSEIWPIIGPADRISCSRAGARSGTSTCCSRWTARASARRPTSPSPTAPSATTRGRSAASSSPARRQRARSRASGSSRCCATSAPRGSRSERTRPTRSRWPAAPPPGSSPRTTPTSPSRSSTCSARGARTRSWSRPRGWTDTTGPGKPARIGTFTASNASRVADRRGARTRQLRRRRRSRRPGSDRCRAGTGARRPSRPSCSAWPAPGRPSLTGVLIAGVSPLRVVSTSTTSACSA